MYAIVEVAGKQYKVEKGMDLFVDKLGEEVNAKITLDKVLYFTDGKKVEIGTPYVTGASVKAEVKDPAYKDKKIIVFKYKNKTGYHKKQGHRQQYTLLAIKDISFGKTAPVKKEEVVEAKPVVKKETAAKKPVTKTTTTKKPATKKASAKKVEGKEKA